MSASLDIPARPLVLEFDSQEPSLLPTLVELRSRDVGIALAFPVNASTRTCTLSVPRNAAFQILPWVPALGTWRVESTELQPGELQHLRVPRPARIAFRLDLPPDSSPAAIRGGIRVTGFSCTWVSSQRGLLSIRELRLDPSSLSTEARMFPGNYRYFFQAPGLAHAGGIVSLEEGQDLVEVVRMEHGVDAEVKVLFSAEARVPVLNLLASDGWRELEGLPLVVTDAHATFRVCLPPGTLEMEALLKRRRGSTRVTPGSLEPGLPRPTLVIELGSAEEGGLADRRQEANRRK